MGVNTAGVPLGYVPSPLLFVIYLNGIIDVVKPEIILFADDTMLFIDVFTIAAEHIILI